MPGIREILDDVGGDQTWGRKGTWDGGTWALMRWNGTFRVTIASFETLNALVRDGYVRGRDQVYDPRTKKRLRAREIPDIERLFQGSPIVAPRTWRQFSCLLSGLFDLSCIAWLWWVTASMGSASRLLVGLLLLALIMVAQQRRDTFNLARLIFSLEKNMEYTIKGEEYTLDQRLLDQVDWWEEERLRASVARNHTVAASLCLVVLFVRSVAG